MLGEEEREHTSTSTATSTYTYTCGACGFWGWGVEALDGVGIACCCRPAVHLVISWSRLLL